MTFLPIVVRELRVSSRRRATYWSRSLMAVVAMLAGTFVYLGVRDEPPHEAGQTLFTVISVTAFIYCLAVGIRATTDCLSEEKREGTLGLLFLTDLKGYDVVGGKLVATSLNAFYGLIAIFPVMAIPLLMGGITNGEFWRVALVLANTFFLSLATGMFMSSISKSPRKAMAATFVFLLFLSVGLVICGDSISYVRESPHLAMICDRLNPCSSLGWAPDLVGAPPVSFAKRATDFWWSVGLIHGLGWILLGLASVIVPRSWQDNPPGVRYRRWRERWHRWSFGHAAERLAFRKRLLDINAFFWLAGRARLKPLHVWFALILVACLWTWGLLEEGSNWTTDWLYFVTAYVLNGMLKFWVASEAGRRLGEDRKIGALELLLSTPLTVPDILRGQMLALKRQFLGPVVAVLIVQCVFLVACLRSGQSEGEGPAFIAFWGAFMLMLVADLIALAPVAMWVSLTARNPNRTTGITLRRVLVLPNAVFLAMAMFIAFFQMASSSAGPGWQVLLGLWFVPGLLADFVFGVTAWRRLNSEFRGVAVQRFAPSVSFWRRLFGAGGQPPEHTPAVVQERA